MSSITIFKVNSNEFYAGATISFAVMKKVYNCRELPVP